MLRKTSNSAGKPLPSSSNCQPPRSQVVTSGGDTFRRWSIVPLLISRQPAPSNTQDFFFFYNYNECLHARGPIRQDVSVSIGTPSGISSTKVRCPSTSTEDGELPIDRLILMTASPAGFARYSKCDNINWEKTLRVTSGGLFLKFLVFAAARFVCWFITQPWRWHATARDWR